MLRRRLTNEAKHLKRRIIGLVEPILIEGPSGTVKVSARMDTGADRTAVDARLAKKLGLGPALRMIRIRAAALEDLHKRPLMRARITLHGESFRLKIGVVDRSEMSYPAIVGRDILASGRFLIDPVLSGRTVKKKIPPRT